MSAVVGLLGQLGEGNVSYSFPFFHADIIPNNSGFGAGVRCPSMACQQVCFRNDPDSTGTAIIGSQNVQLGTNRGMPLQPGEWSPWIPTDNVENVWHREVDATTNLHYMIIY